MSQIRSKNTKPEILVRKFLHSKGFRYRLHNKLLPGKPDIVLKKYNAVVFIHGCFWHGHSKCNSWNMPKTRRKYWENKISGNKNKDKRQLKKLDDLGFKVVVIWECQLKKDSKNEILNDLIRKITG